ncbi:MAG: acetyl-CoA carboxylase carboxyltransferase subunit beta [Firmicutes bacterium]|nr:acetyl-CoA carboxylase carboxyltransferase subunit beta [Bacillota bacterium]
METLRNRVKDIKLEMPRRTDKQKEETPVPSTGIKCPSCENVFEKKELGKLKICPKCARYFRLNSKERIRLTVDEGSFTEMDDTLQAKNPLNFPDYEEKIAKMQEKTNLKDAVITGTCTIGGEKAVIGVMDSGFMMASMGSVVGEKLTRAFEYATKNKLPIIIFACSGGARMQEGIVSLMQMAKVSAAAARHSKEGLLYITVLTDPTTGGVTASFAMLGDIIISEPKALIGFAGRRVIEGTIKQKLPDEFQTAEFQLEHGFVDIIVTREEMPIKLRDILRLHSGRKGGAE